MKNKAAVHLGRLSAASRKRKLGMKAYREEMRKLRAKGTQKSPVDKEQ